MANPALMVYPNPLTDGVVAVQLTNMPKGSYYFTLQNNLGQTIVKKSINHLGGNHTQKIPLGTVKTRGVYQVEIIQPDRTRKIIQVVY